MKKPMKEHRALPQGRTLTGARCPHNMERLEEALRHCGVTETTLAPREKDALDRQGYLVLPGVIDREWLARLRVAFEAALGDGQRTGQFCLMSCDDPVYDGLYKHPKILASAHHILRRPFSAAFPVCGRDPLPGHGQQALHSDWLPRTGAEPFQLVTTLWLLDDFTPTNGATRVLPGTHRMTRLPGKSLQQAERRHPEEQLILASAGSVLIFNGHLWHSGTRNQAGERRRVLMCKFVARDLRRPDEPRPAIPQRFTPAVRYILGED